jgi:hypothetical protein
MGAMDMARQVAARIRLWRALKAPDPVVRIAAVEGLGRFRSLRGDPGALCALKERLRVEEDFGVQLALVRTLLRLGGLEAADRELLDILAGKWDRYFREAGLEPDEQRRALAALLRKLRRERARRENPHPVPPDRIRAGTKVLYRERAILPGFDQIRFEARRPRLEETRRQTLAGELRPHRRSPAGFIQVHPDDPEWLDLNDLSRRIYLGVVRAVRRGRVFVGDPRWSEGLDPADILEVLPDEG